MPEVVGGVGGSLVVADPHNALGRHTDLLGPDIVSLVIGGIDSHQQLFLWQLQNRGQKTPGKGDGFTLEVIAKAEVAQHLKKGVVTRRIADVVQIVVLAAGPHTALRRGRTAVIADITAKKHILELVHPGIGKQQSRIVVRNQRTGSHDLVAFGTEILEKRGADL